MSWEHIIKEKSRGGRYMYLDAFHGNAKITGDMIDNLRNMLGKSKYPNTGVKRFAQEYKEMGDEDNYRDAENLEGEIRRLISKISDMQRNMQSVASNYEEIIDRYFNLMERP